MRTTFDPGATLSFSAKMRPTTTGGVAPSRPTKVPSIIPAYRRGGRCIEDQVGGHFFPCALRLNHHVPAAQADAGLDHFLVHPVRETEEDDQQEHAGRESQRREQRPAGL